MFGALLSVIEQQKPNNEHVSKIKILTNLVHSNEFILNRLDLIVSNAIVVKIWIRRIKLTEK